MDCIGDLGSMKESLYLSRIMMYICLYEQHLLIRLYQAYRKKTDNIQINLGLVMGKS